MTIWQADLYPVSSANSEQGTVWEWMLCDRHGNLIEQAMCSQGQSLDPWLVTQFQNLSVPYPDRLQVFRPECGNVLKRIAAQLGISIATTRHTPAIKHLLKQQGKFVPVQNPPPQPLPDRLWGKQWRFASLPAGEVVREFRDRPIPILDIPPEFEPLQQGLSSSLLVPGIIVEGGRQAMQLARWVQEVQPYALNYIPAEAERSGGIVLEAGLCDRWVFQTFEDPEVAHAAKGYQHKLQQSQGLHFLLIQPDDFGGNFTGYWLLLNED